VEPSLVQERDSALSNSEKTQGRRGVLCVTEFSKDGGEVQTHHEQNLRPESGVQSYTLFSYGPLDSNMGEQTEGGFGAGRDWLDNLKLDPFVSGSTIPAD